MLYMYVLDWCVHKNVGVLHVLLYVLDCFLFLNVYWTGMLYVLGWCVVCTCTGLLKVTCTRLMCCMLWTRASVFYGLV